jgi:hypothetical protein
MIFATGQGQGLKARMPSTKVRVFPKNLWKRKAFGRVGGITMKCRNCGAPDDGMLSACPRCGADLECSGSRVEKVSDAEPNAKSPNQKTVSETNPAAISK